MPHRIRKAATPVLLDRGAAWREEQVDPLELALQQIRVAPELRRAMVTERAPQTGRRLTKLAVLLPEIVHRAHQPVVVRRVNAQRVFAIPQHAGPKQGHEVEMHDVEVLRGEDPIEGVRFQPRLSAQIGDKRRQRAPSAMQPVNGDVWMVRKLASRACRGQQPK